MKSSLNNYLFSHSRPVSDALLWIEKQTNVRTNYPQMLSGQVQGSLLKILVEISAAKRVLELGSFTGYSSTCMALGLPEDGLLDAFEINDELEDLMREGWSRAGVSSKIQLHIGDAVELLKALPKEEIYDFVFIDANKRQYCEYYELVLPLLKKGGLIVADDVLWAGKVYTEPIEKDAQTQSLVRFNDLVASDPRTESVIIPLRDGLTLIRKL